METKALSSKYHAQILNSRDIDLIYQLSCKNETFYKYHPPFVSRESIQDDMNALPPGKDYKDKFYIGFFEGDNLVAIMDLILGYPSKEVAYVGLFMMNVEYQNKGIGSSIIKECVTYLQSQGYKRIRLGADKGNQQSYTFWKKNGFVVVAEGEYISMELEV